MRRSRALLLFRTAQRSFALPPKQQQQTTAAAPPCLRSRIEAKTDVSDRRPRLSVSTDANSQLDAFRHPFDERDAHKHFFNWSAVICDRYAFLMRLGSRLDVIKVYIFDTGAVQFVH